MLRAVGAPDILNLRFPVSMVVTKATTVNRPG